jgi:hypothetical protein
MTNVSTHWTATASNDGGYASWSDFLAARLYTLVLPSVIALALCIHSGVSKRHKSLGFPYAGARTWWEPVAWIRLRFVWAAGTILQEAYYKVRTGP